MQISGNTILITGGTSGIGRALAEAFHAEGNQVIITGRRKHLLDEITAMNPGMKAAILDVEDSDAIASVAEQLKIDHPDLNVVIHNAGIMRSESVQEGKIDDAEATVATNLLAPIRLTSELIESRKLAVCECKGQSGFDYRASCFRQNRRNPYGQFKFHFHW